MTDIRHTDIYSLSDYSKHLKNLSDKDKTNRFGYKATDYAIDHLVLQMIYNPGDHELWVATDGNKIVGFGHMARTEENSWELAVSVDNNYQRKGIGGKLISEMLVWAKFHKISEVFMNCIEDNRVIQHLANKYDLKTRDRTSGERTAAIQVPAANLIEVNSQLMKEQSEIISQINELRGKLIKLWFNPKL